ncbi:MAG: hypothetical protein ACYTHM_22005, partial [Planctomycetota bacterium]
NPIWKAVEEGWKAAAKVGVTQVLPPGFSSGKTPRLDGSQGYNNNFYSLRQRLLDGSAWLRQAQAAQRAAKSLNRGIAKVEKIVGAAGKDSLDDPRSLAVLKTLEAQLKAARFNLRQLRFFCLEVEKELKNPSAKDPLEIPLVPPPPAQPHRMAIDFDTRYFCHGTIPVRAVRWLGGPEGEKEIEALCDIVDRNLKEHRRTPFELANRRIPLAVFRIVYYIEGNVQVRTRKRREKDEKEDEPVTTPRRNRRGGREGREGGGPSTGGGGK